MITEASFWNEQATYSFGWKRSTAYCRTCSAEAVERWIRHYEDNRQDGEEFNDFVDRVDTAVFEELVKGDLALPPEFNLETMTTFVDWNRDVPFEVIRGEGECAV